MCRLLVYKSRSKEHAVRLSDLIVHPSHSIIKQSFDAKERLTAGAVPPALNADGFGIAWYSIDDEDQGPDVEAGLYRSIAPAWNDANLTRLSSKIKSDLVFAHVRAASLGSMVSQANCHPFTYQNYTWMHNGQVAEFRRIKRALTADLCDEAFDFVQGSSDSEYCFALFISELVRLKEREKLPPRSSTTCNVMMEALVITIQKIEKWCRDAGVTSPALLNFVVTDGNAVLATKHVIGDGIAATLYFSSGSKWAESPAGSGAYRMIQTDKREHAVIITSERLTAVQEDWVEVPTNHMVVVCPRMNVLVVPVPSVFDKTSAASSDFRGALNVHKPSSGPPAVPVDLNCPWHYVASRSDGHVRAADATFRPLAPRSTEAFSGALPHKSALAMGFAAAFMDSTQSPSPPLSDEEAFPLAKKRVAPAAATAKKRQRVIEEVLRADDAEPIDPNTLTAPQRRRAFSTGCSFLPWFCGMCS